MPWSTPTLRQVRMMIRDDVTATLSGAILVGNSVLRVMSDTSAGMAHLVLRYIDWLARQLLPDTAETEWLDRHGNIWLHNADSSVGRKHATLAAGTATMTGVLGTVVPIATELNGLGVSFETTEEITLGVGDTPVAIRALDAGIIGNLDPGERLSFSSVIIGSDDSATVVFLDGGTDDETDDELRARVLFRIQKPPMGGDASDYIAWTMSLPGVTRAWSYPNEMGIGTVTVRFLMDELRADNYGIPNPDDINTASDYLNTVRPVAVKDFFIEAPVPFFYDLTITDLVDSSPSVQAAIEVSIKAMEKERISPGTRLYRSWIEEAIGAAVGEDHHELIFDTTTMPAPGYMATLGTIRYV